MGKMKKLFQKMNRVDEYLSFVELIPGFWLEMVVENG